ncbi:MAG TPA: TVP38/TMEM64 family protein [Ferrovibrio sp.]|uniref:TVP38/TMEM64 family protein n=1 Tax=Ferrovibrio sp. TaxID=1917215 RepID=UPI002ED5A9C1
MTLKRLLPLLVLALGLVLFLAFDLGRFFDLAALRAHQSDLRLWVAAHPLLAPLAYTGFYTILVAFSLPIASFVTLAGGILFGAWLGTLWTAIGATLGAGIVFLAARTALAASLRARAGQRLAKLEREIRDNGFHYLLFLRLVPLFPFWLVNIAPALVGMRLMPYLVATALGILPGTFVFAYFGQGLSNTLQKSDTLSLSMIASPEILIALTLLALLSLLPIWIKRRQAGRSRQE